MDQKQLKLLKKKYNEALIRFNKMEAWCKTATPEEQKKHYGNVIKVINDCSNLLNEIKKYDKFVCANEVIYGFKEV
ncbi:hypothetical protein GOQ27_06960 [Clostridium sp. D2Q-11]|uniref:Uncharacterized protein n=1 Tax=Anaeromonas frigoriresistens TaxID=2683708 RepID=A0A942UWH7_9FIRM|nr:hypothetical protein [Anaeromonas frigoriresistens]MBS4538196.1 hypothetical protein [Anaeromonas frigoriresistens]